MNINTIHSTPKAVELNTDKTHNIQKPTTVLPEKQKVFKKTKVQ